MEYALQAWLFTKQLARADLELRDRPINLKGGDVMVFCFVKKKFFWQHES